MKIEILTPDRQTAVEKTEDFAFGLVVYSALIQLAKAFLRRYSKKEPLCRHCKKPI